MSFIPYPTDPGAAKIERSRPGAWESCTVERARGHFEALQGEGTPGWSLSVTNPFARQHVFAADLRTIANKPLGKRWPVRFQLWSAMLVAHGLREDTPRFIEPTLRFRAVVLKDSVLRSFFPGASEGTRIVRSASIPGWHTGPIAFHEWPDSLVAPSIDLFGDDGPTEAGERLIAAFNIWREAVHSEAQRRFIARWLHRLEKGKLCPHIDGLWAALIRSLLPDTLHFDYSSLWSKDTPLDTDDFWNVAPGRKLIRERIARGVVQYEGKQYVIGMTPDNMPGGLQGERMFVDDETPISVWDLEQNPSGFDNPSNKVLVLRRDDLFLPSATGFRAKLGVSAMEGISGSRPAGPWRRFDAGRLLVINDITDIEMGHYCALPLTEFGLNLIGAHRTADKVKVEGVNAGGGSRVSLRLAVSGASDWGVEDCVFSQTFGIDRPAATVAKKQDFKSSVQTFDLVPFFAAWPPTQARLNGGRRYFYYNLGLHAPEMTLRIVPHGASEDSLIPEDPCFSVAGFVSAFSVQRFFGRGDWRHAGFVFPATNWGRDQIAENEGRWLVGIDFGSTNTAVSLGLMQGDSPPSFPRAFAAGPREQVESLLDSPAKGYENAVSRNFLPLQVPNPLTTCLRLRKSGIIDWKESFISYILIPDDPTAGGTASATQIMNFLKFNLKWGMGDERKYVKAFLAKLIEIVLVELSARGASTRSHIELRFAYPSAFSVAQRAEFEADIKSVTAFLIGKTGFTNLSSAPPQPESIAVMRYYTLQREFASLGCVYVDIGGGTTDIGITEPLEDPNAAPHVAFHSSIKYAGRWLLCEPIARHLTTLLATNSGTGSKQNVGSHSDWFDVFGAGERLRGLVTDGVMALGANIVEVALKTKQETVLTWWRSVGESREFRLVEEVYCRGAALFYYLGMVCRNVRVPDSLAICLAGNGSHAIGLIFELEVQNRERLLSEMFLKGFSAGGPASLSPPKQIRIVGAEHPKQEVAIGLAQRDDKLRIAPEAQGFVVGEDVTINGAPFRFWEKLPDPEVVNLSCSEGLPTLVAFIEAYNAVLPTLIKNVKDRERFMLNGLFRKQKGIATDERELRLRKVANAVNLSVGRAGGLPVFLAAIDEYWSQYERQCATS